MAKKKDQVVFEPKQSKRRKGQYKKSMSKSQKRNFKKYRGQGR